MKEENLKTPFTRPLTAKELAALPDSEIDLSDIPETTDAWFEKARVIYPHERKQQLTVRLDADIVDFFKSQGPRYQTRMNEVLKTYVNAMRKP
ncbi:MAG: BrnA antitoxin family protein [Rhizobiaceae bacterium]